MLERRLRALADSPIGPPLRAVRRRLLPELRRDQRDRENLSLLLAFTLAADSSCIDVGSYRGDVLAEFLARAPRGRHIAYEPVPDLHAELARRFPGIDVRCAALSNREGEAGFAYVRSRPGYSGFRRRSYPGKEDVETITVRVETLDASLPPGYVPALIKIDVEGAEGQVIEGALETIAEHRPIVVFEHGAAAAEYGTRPETVYRLLCGEAGLRIFDLDGNGPYSSAEFAATSARGDYWNFVAHD
jgi:FkbM family methyltransferase